LFAIVGLFSLAVYVSLFFADQYVKKQNVVDCFKVQEYALKYPDKLNVTKEYYAKCVKLDIIINVKELK